MSKVTSEVLTTMIETADEAKRQAIIGRALVVIFNNQTEGEKASNQTNKDNGVGFTGADAHSGCITAKYYLKYQRLLDWQVDKWIKRNRNGVMRIAKYHKQLDAAAKSKAQG